MAKIEIIKVDMTSFEEVKRLIRYNKYLEAKIRFWNIAFNEYDIWRKINDKDGKGDELFS